MITLFCPTDKNYCFPSFALSNCGTGFAINICSFNLFAELKGNSKKENSGAHAFTNYEVALGSKGSKNTSGFRSAFRPPSYCMAESNHYDWKLF